MELNIKNHVYLLEAFDFEPLASANNIIMKYHVESCCKFRMLSSSLSIKCFGLMIFVIAFVIEFIGQRKQNIDYKNKAFRGAFCIEIQHYFYLLVSLFVITYIIC